jgi:hypothetical protein
MMNLWAPYISSNIFYDYKHGFEITPVCTEFSRDIRNFQNLRRKKVAKILVKKTISFTG